MNIKELVEKAYANAASKGFHSIHGVTFGDRIALIHSEASEALEAYREYGHLRPEVKPFSEKPEGVPSELADIVIRVADMCGLYGIDLEKAIEQKMAYNATRPHLHGKKF